MNLHMMMQKIADEENKEIYEVYRKYYTILTEKYPECQLIKDPAESKLKQIERQGFTDKLKDILNEDHKALFELLDVKYTSKQKIKIFENELNLIGGSVESNDVNNDIKSFVVRALTKVPDYFFNIPASSTGKYHPNFAIQPSGLAKHVKAAVKIALDLFEVEVFGFDGRTKGLALAAIILHDCAKNGFNGSNYTVPQHPILITDFLEENVALDNLSKEDYIHIKKAINSHMGKWNTSRGGKKEITPKPKTKLEYFVHICDLFASRKYIDFDFSADFDVLDFK